MSKVSKPASSARLNRTGSVGSRVAPHAREMPAWPRGAGLVGAGGVFTSKRSLARFTQGPPIEYVRCSDPLTDGCANHFDPSALWLFTVLVELWRRNGKAPSQSELARQSGFSKSRTRRLLNQLNQAGLLIRRTVSAQGREVDLVVWLPSVDHVRWRLEQDHAETCERTESVRRVLSFSGEVGDLEEALAAEVALAVSQTESQDSHGGKRARSHVSTTPTGPSGKNRKNRREETQPLFDVSNSAGAVLLEKASRERYFPERCPAWGDSQWFENLCRRVPKEVALSAVGQVTFQLDLVSADPHGREEVRNPRGLAWWLANHYAGKVSGGNASAAARRKALEVGERERAAHEAARREAVYANAKKKTSSDLGEAAATLIAMGLFPEVEDLDGESDL